LIEGLENLQENKVDFITDKVKFLKLYPSPKWVDDVRKWQMKIVGVEDEEQGYDIATVGLESGNQVKTKLIVAADGANSFCRQHLCIPVTSWNYKQKAVVGTVKTEAENFCAYQRFLRNSIIAMLPVSSSWNV
jgi:2-polyprenyl-6-methoxyphenol hydroxylase-like FAD-dependent oxidoreductase